MNARKAIVALVVMVATLGVFVLPAAASADGPCPNEAIREEQHSTALPECRAYEKVTPLDKNGGDISADKSSVLASTAGDAVAFMARASFGDTIGSSNVGQTVYLARRGQTGWTNHAISPTPAYDGSAALVAATAILGFSDDLRRSVIWGYDLPGAEESLPQAPNIYSEENDSRSLRLVTTPLALESEISDPVVFRSLFISSFAFPNTGGISRDSRHLAFTSFAQLLPGAPPSSFSSSVYQWDDGVLRLASLLPDGSPAPFARLASPDPGPLEGYRETVSPDGSRVLFTSGGQLYMRVDHASTAWVSEPEVSGPPPTPEGVVLRQVTGDSRHVIFATTSPLVDSDTNGEPDLYLYTDGPDPENEDNLRLLTDGVLSDAVVIGSSDNGEQIYYLNNQKIRLWADGVTTLVADDVSSLGGTENQGLTATASAPGGSRVSPNGRYLAFLLGSGPTRDGFPVADSGEHIEIYVYDSVDDTLKCASCPSSGPATADAEIIPSATNISPAGKLLGSRPDFLADSGKTFFSTAEPLVSQDVNGLTDTYEFDPATGTAVLISTGTGSQPAAFAAASASGDDAFILTRQRLVKADRDGLVDLYDVRVGGGISEPPDPAPPCEGDACQRPPSTSPGDLGSASSSFHGPGNVKHNRGARCAKTRRKAHRNGKTRCVKKNHKRANSNRRAAR